MKTIDLVYFNAGGGHRAAARALEAVIRQQSRPWQVRLVNLFEILDPREIFRRTAGFKPEDFYNTRLAHGWTLGLEQELKLLQAVIRLGRDPLTMRMRKHWQMTRPDMVVSLIPNFNRVMCGALAQASPGAPFVVIMTDFADHPPHFWIEPRQRQHMICGTQRSALQARAAAQDKSTIYRTSGMIISPDFYSPLDIKRDDELRCLGLDPGKPTGLVLFGGHGSKVMQSIAARLEDTQLILICGHNAELAERLRAMPARAPRHVVGFTSRVRYYMAVSDFFIGKPGPGSISEALQQRLPVILARNAWTMPQERYNTDWVLENEVGLVLRSFKTIHSAVIEMKERLPEFRRRVERIRNHAVFEIPEIFDRILRDAAAGRAARTLSSHGRIVGEAAEIELS